MSVVDSKGVPIYPEVDAIFASYLKSSQPIQFKGDDDESESQDEINRILSKLENQETNLEDSLGDYQRLIQLNKHIDNLFKMKFKEISEQKK